MTGVVRFTGKRPVDPGGPFQLFTQSSPLKGSLHSALSLTMFIFSEIGSDGRRLGQVASEAVIG
jgi:hypothetical protein